MIKKNLAARLTAAMIALGVVLAGGMVSAQAASAADDPLAPYQPVLPDPGSVGMMGTPTRLIPSGAGTSAIDIPGAWTAPGTQVATWNAVDNAWNQVWKFSWAGKLPILAPDPYSKSPNAAEYIDLHLYLMVATTPGGEHLCLKAESNTPDARVVTATCNTMDPLQLWGVIDPKATVQPRAIWNGEDIGWRTGRTWFNFFPTLNSGTALGNTVLINAASLYYNPTTSVPTVGTTYSGSAPLIMSATATLSGAYSKITIGAPWMWGDKLISGQKWMIRDLNTVPTAPPTTTPTVPQPTQPTCTGLACLVSP